MGYHEEKKKKTLPQKKDGNGIFNAEYPPGL
jgi:hypothetical protein